MSRKALQVITALFGLGAVGSGVGAMAGLENPTYASLGLPPAAVLDNNLRFYAGVWMGLGFAALWIVPGIEKQAALFRTICGALFLGGIGRLISMMSLGEPPVEYIAYAAVEIFGSILLVVWQRRIASALGGNDCPASTDSQRATS